MLEDDFESLPPPPYTLMADDSNGVNLLGLASTETPTSVSRPRPMSAPTFQTTPSISSARYVYYELFGSASTLSSKCAFDSENDSIGRVPARKIAPPRTAAIVKRYIAQLEGIDPTQITIYTDAESDHPIPDDTRIAIFEEGGPGTSLENPLAISLRDGDHLATPSPVLMPTPSLYGGTPPSPAGSLPYVSHTTMPLPHPPASERSMSFSSRHSAESLAVPGQAAAPPANPRWTIGEDGFAEPIESPREAGKVVSQRQPPGWMSGRIQFIGHGIFMGKLGKKHGNITQGGTVLRDGMRVWVDARTLKHLTIRTGDTFRTYRVIIQETREIVYLWTGDIFIDSVQI